MLQTKTDFITTFTAVILLSAAPQVVATLNTEYLSTIAISTTFSPELVVNIDRSCSPYEGDKLTSVRKIVIESETQLNSFDFVDKIKALKVALGLPSTAIADIFQITRQTLHSYFKPNYDKKINSKTLERSIQLEKVTQLIQDHLDRSPGALAKNSSVEGVSLFSLLKNDELEFDKIEVIVKNLAEKMSKPVQGLSFNQQTLYDLTSST